MARKKSYPGGFRLTLATARRLAVQEFGTAKGLEPDRGTYLEGFFTMRMGNMGISISPDLGMSGCIVVRAGLCTASHTCIGYIARSNQHGRFDGRNGGRGMKPIYKPKDAAAEYGDYAEMDKQ